MSLTGLLQQPVPYTPLVIQYRPAVLYADGMSASHTLDGDVWLEVIPPRSILSGVTQPLPQSAYVKVPEDGLVKLKLLPSENYTWPGRYVVHYRVGDLKNRPFRTEHWVVPVGPRVQTAVLVHTGGLDVIPVAITLAVYEVIEVTHPGQWRLYENAIVWVENPPAVGQSYTVVYQEGITLDALVTPLTGSDQKWWPRWHPQPPAPPYWH